MPCVPVALVELLITGAGGFTVSVNVAVPVPVALVALIVTEDVPADEGVPLMTPVEVFTLKPAGRPVAL